MAFRFAISWGAAMTDFVAQGTPCTGASVGIGKGSLTLTVPLSLASDFKSDLTPTHPKGGDLADYLVFAGYTYRF